MGSAVASNPIGETQDVMLSLSILVAGVLATFAFHLFLLMPLLAYVTTRTNPYTHLRGMTKAMALSMGCASSAVTLPVNILCCEAMGYQPSVVRFVLSLGATVSMDGVAIYLPAAIIWLAYQAGMTLSFVQIVVLAIISTLAS